MTQVPYNGGYSKKMQEEEGKTCSCFLPSLAKDSHELCTVCRGQVCNVVLRCDH